MKEFKFGTVTVPDGKSGDWSIDTFTITPEECTLYNMRAAMNGNGYLMLEAGTYKRLACKGRGVVMSNTPMEITTAYECYRDAHGRVLINGLGLGMVLEGVLSKPEVTFVKVIEIDEDVIKLVGPHFQKYVDEGRLEIVCMDAHAYKPAKGETYDYVWHDIWDDISSSNLKDMGNLTRKYARRAPKQGVWSRREARRERQRSYRDSRSYSIW